MGEKRAIKHEAEAIWTAVKDDRRARAKLVGAHELSESAEILIAHAEDLAELAKRARAAQDAVMTETAARAKTKRRKAKPDA